jgi:hypothetical protein
MIAMWLIPFGLSIKFFYIRFILIWCFFTAVTVYVTRRATRQPVIPTTPRWRWAFCPSRTRMCTTSLLSRLVYKWFLLVYKVSYGLAIGGYCLIMMTFLGINNLLLISPQVSQRWTMKPCNSLISLDIAGFRYLNHVLRDLLRRSRKRHGWIVYRSNGSEDRSEPCEKTRLFFIRSFV